MNTIDRILTHNEPTLMNIDCFKIGRAPKVVADQQSSLSRPPRVETAGAEAHG
jgi:hypothetical protein